MKFLEVPAGGFDRILAIELQDFPERGFECCKPLFARCFLAIDARDFLNPPDPPIAFLLDDCGVGLIHGISVPRFQMAT